MALFYPSDLFLNLYYMLSFFTFEFYLLIWFISLYRGQCPTDSWLFAGFIFIEANNQTRLASSSEQHLLPWGLQVILRWLKNMSASRGFQGCSVPTSSTCYPIHVKTWGSRGSSWSQTYQPSGSKTVQEVRFYPLKLWLRNILHQKVPLLTKRFFNVLTQLRTSVLDLYL